MKKSLSIITLTTALTLSGCATVSSTTSSATEENTIQQTTSKDGYSTSITLNHSAIATPSDNFSYYQLGARWSSMHPEQVYLAVKHPAHAPQSPLTFKKLDIELNGILKNYKSLTSVKQDNELVIPMSLFNEMLKADSVKLKIHTNESSEIVDFSQVELPYGQLAAKHYLKSFMSKIALYHRLKEVEKESASTK
ncbi:hypothetical protein [Pleionea sp. CnH1-48]|uniref:hypothetical protein n=1 Tax=Pleionea sp. CnH1-48 TaxID=2954494 RepID=UPI0020986704|nr:hypothetical protein [Pleionea sp. CnH1-48]MCO7227595.1 hypothetical protein [Pleionea sp. CnH1-48]